MRVLMIGGVHTLRYWEGRTQKACSLDVPWHLQTPPPPPRGGFLMGSTNALA